MEIDFSVGRGGSMYSNSTKADKKEVTAYMLQRKRERDAMVRDIMRKYGLTYKQSSAFIKENNLF